MALAWCLLVSFPATASAQSVSDGIDILNRAARLEQSAGTRDDLNRVIHMYGEAQRIFERVGFRPGIAGVSNNLGVVYMHVGEFRKAAEHFKSAFAIFRESGDKHRQIQVLVNLGIIYKQLGKNAEAMAYCQQALDMSQYASDPKVKGQIFNAMGNICEEADRYSEASTYYKNAVAIWEATGNRRGDAITRNNLATVLQSLGKYTEALAYGKQSLSLCTSIGDRRQEAIVLTNLGGLSRTMGDYPEAVKLYNESAQISKAIDDPTLRVKTLNNLGVIYREWGQYAKAIGYYNETLSVGVKSDAPTIEGAARFNLGGVYADWGFHAKAVENYNMALTLWAKVGHPRGQAQALIGLGQALENMGQHDQALAKFKETLAIQEKIGVDTMPITGMIGHFYLDRKEMGNARPFVVKSKSASAMGRLCLMERDYVRAREAYDELLVRAEKTGSVENLFVACTGLGLAHEGMEHHSEAAGYFRKAVDLTEELRSSLPKAQRDNFFDVKSQGFGRVEPYKGLARVLLRMNRVLDSIKFCEYSKARVFADYLSQKPRSSDYDASPDLMSQDMELRDRMAALKRSRQQAYEKGNKETVTTIDRLIRELDGQLKNHVERLREKSPLYAAVKYPQPSDLAQTGLREDELVLAYDVSGYGLLSYLLRGKKVLKAVFKPVVREEIDELVSRFRGPFEGANKANLSDKLGSFDVRAGKKLADILLGDFIGLIPEGPHITIVPDESLGVLPFEMLILNDGGTVTAEKGGFPIGSGTRFLGDRNPISYYQSLTALTLTRAFVQKDMLQAQRLLVMADPVFNMADARCQGRQLSPSRLSEAEKKLHEDLVFMVTAEEEDPVAQGYRRLRTTGELALKLGELYGDQADIYTGLGASKETFFSRIAPHLDRYGQIVFATHGDFGKELPGLQQPVLVLTTVPPGTDGFLRISEVVNLKMNAEVVALTTCKSGLGRRLSGEGTMGMGRAFQFAGARSVLMSLWNVEEKSSVKLVESFFRHMKEGNGKIESLRLARSEIRREGYDHPFFWASFVLVGEAESRVLVGVRPPREELDTTVPKGTGAVVNSPDDSRPFLKPDAFWCERLLEACKHGQLMQAKRLLDEGADLRCRDRQFGGTPLHWASYGGHEQIALLLLAKGAAPNALNAEGRTPLMLAAGMGHRKMVEMLLERGADPKSADRDGKTARDWAFQRGYRSVVHALKSHPR